jgi:hypothetical protein
VGLLAFHNYDLCVNYELNSKINLFYLSIIYLSIYNLSSIIYLSIIYLSSINHLSSIIYLSIIYLSTYQSSIYLSSIYHLSSIYLAINHLSSISIIYHLSIIYLSFIYLSIYLSSILLVLFLQWTLTNTCPLILTPEPNSQAFGRHFKVTTAEEEPEPGWYLWGSHISGSPGRGTSRIPTRWKKMTISLAVGGNPFCEQVTSLVGVPWRFSRWKEPNLHPFWYSHFSV